MPQSHWTPVKSSGAQAQATPDAFDSEPDDGMRWLSQDSLDE